MKKAPEDIGQEANYGFSLGFVEASFLEVAVVGVVVGFVWIFKHDVNYGFGLSFFEAGGIEDTSGFLDSVLSVPELVEAGRRPISLVSVGAQAQGINYGFGLGFLEAVIPKVASGVHTFKSGIVLFRLEPVNEQGINYGFGIVLEETFTEGAAVDFVPVFSQDVN